MGAKYKVTSINKRLNMLPDGTFVQVYEVSFETESGVRDSIQIPVEKFTKEHVKEALDQAVANIEAIMKL